MLSESLKIGSASAEVLPSILPGEEKAALQQTHCLVQPNRCLKQTMCLFLWLRGLKGRLFVLEGSS